MPGAPRPPASPSPAARRAASPVRRGILAAAALAAAGAAAVGGLTGGPPAGSPAPAAAAPARPAPPGAPARAVSPCTAVPGCGVVSRADVDGDRRDDQVGLVVRGTGRADAPGTVRVRVRTAAGRTLDATVRNVWWFGRPDTVWAGATAVDGRAGAELVVGQRMGAHTRQFRVLTYRSGTLVTLASPTAPNRPGPPGDPAVWTVDGSHAFQAGVSRSASEGLVTVVLTTVERSPSGRGHAGRALAYRWSGSGWAPVSATGVRFDGDAAAAAVGGWHLPGLPRFGRDV